MEGVGGVIDCLWEVVVFGVFLIIVFIFLDVVVVVLFLLFNLVFMSKSFGGGFWRNERMFEWFILSFVVKDFICKE